MNKFEVHDFVEVVESEEFPDAVGFQFEISATHGRWFKSEDECQNNYWWRADELKLVIAEKELKNVLDNELDLCNRQAELYEFCEENVFKRVLTTKEAWLAIQEIKKIGEQ